MDYTKEVYVRVLSFFKNLKHLSVQPFSGLCPSSLFLSLPSTNFCCSTLTKLCITVHDFADCLFLLDGHLKQLSTFIVSIDLVVKHPSIVHNSVSWNRISWTFLDKERSIWWMVHEERMFFVLRVIDL